MLKHAGLAVFLFFFAGIANAFEFRLSVSDSNDTLDETIRAASLTASLKQDDKPKTVQDVLAAARADYARIVGSLYDAGHFAPTVSIQVNGREAAQIPALSPPSSVNRVDITVEPGPVFTFGRARVSPLAPETQLPEGFATDQQASVSAMREAVTAGITGWRDQGHAKASVADQSVTARHAQNRLDADIRLTPGPKLRFGQLQVTGNRRMRAERIREIAGLPEGDVFDPADLRRAALRLRRSGVFASVALTEAETPTSDGRLDVVAQVAESRRRRFGFGAELSSREGLMLSTFWLHRNLFGGGERLRFDAEMRGIGGDTGGEDYEIGVTFGRPATFSVNTDFFATLEIVSLDEPNYESERVSVEAGLRHYASDNREYSYAIGYEAAETRDAFGSRSYRVLTFPLSAEWDYRNDELNATSGYYANASVMPFVGVSGTDNGARVLLDARAYRSTGTDDRVTFALRGQLGAIFGPSLTRVPTDYLFYSGGGGTVRGQEYQSLGVDVGGGRIIGGRSFLGLSSEIRVKTGDKLSVVGFFDAGYVGEESFPDGSSGDWHTGAGAGVRYDTGLGPIRFDVAVPLSGPDDENGFELYIGIGQAF
jgi:translocation and assembly module TamA